MKSSIEHKMSHLLSKEENDQVFRMFNPKSQSLATAVIQLYLTQGPDHSHWIKKDTGVMCFVKDHSRKNYFFRLYCLNRRMLIWEQELYHNLEYKSPSGFFHTFEATDCVCAFNFASEDEAVTMKTIAIEKINFKKQRREERRRNAALPSNQTAINYNTNITNNNFVYNQQNSILNNYAPQTAATKRKRNLTKADISLPKDFKHISHVGWDPNKGFDINGENPELKKFFTKAGVSDMQLRDKDTRNFIYDFINEHGGLDAVKSEVTDTQPKKASVPRPGQENAPANPPPPVPARTPVNRTAPPPPPPNKVKPPTQARAQPPPRPAAIHTGTVPTIAEPPPTNNVPAPPPPPPPMDFGGAPFPPPSAPPTNPTADPRAALMESIRAGKNLKPVEVERKPSVSDSRGELLNEIRQGIELKPVQNNQRPSSGPSVQENSLAEALSNALKARAFAIHSESESDSGNSTDDEEWEQDD